MSDLAAFRSALGGLKVEDNPAIVKQKSRDFFWYSPVLKRQLDAVSGDLVVTPETEEDVVRVLAAAYAHDVPVTVRGGGTGNYGQAMPLSRGVILDLTQLNRVISIGRGSVVAEAGAIIANIDAEARSRSGQELRMHPSTFRTATIGGFIAGGSGGIGSIKWGGLRDPGNVIRLKVWTLEETPRVIGLTGEDVQKVVHAYGTNGVVTQVEMPLPAAFDWVDALATFADLLDPARFADGLGNQDGIVVKEIGVIDAPLPHDYFLRHRKFLPRDKVVVAVMVAEIGMAAFADFTARTRGAALVFRSDTASEDEKRGLPPVAELVWNHTTLRGLRVEPGITYLQTLFPFPAQLEAIARVRPLLGDDVVEHLEFVRFDGRVTCFGLPVIRYTNDERLDEIVRIYEDNGCPVFNPHAYTLEEGGMKQTDAVQLAFKRVADPKGLLNPGKLIAWDDPDYDYSAPKTYLFRGLAPVEG